LVFLKFDTLKLVTTTLQIYEFRDERVTHVAVQSESEQVVFVPVVREAEAVVEH